MFALSFLGFGIAFPVPCHGRLLDGGPFLWAFSCSCCFDLSASFVSMVLWCFLLVCFLSCSFFVVFYFVAWKNISDLIMCGCLFFSIPYLFPTHSSTSR